jgi:hypothetical protein
LINQRLIALVAVAGALAAYFVWSDSETLMGRLTGRNQAISKAPSSPAGQPQQSAGTDRSAVSLNPLSGIGVDTLSAMVDRPLFNPSRAPAPKQQEPAPVPVVTTEPVVVENAFNSDDFTLLAVASNATDKTAVVRQNSTAEVFHLKSGQLLSGWEVLVVDEREITLGQQGKSFQLKLFQKPAADAPQPAGEVESTGDGSPQGLIVSPKKQ